MLEKSIGPLTEAMQNNHGESFSLDILKNLLRENIVVVAYAKRGVQLSVVLVFPVWMALKS